MPVTDEELVWLRAYLAGDDEMLRRVHPRVARAGAAGIGALVQAAFTLAARGKFAPQRTRDEVSGFVARVRALPGQRHAALDPLVAEQQLRGALGEKVAATSNPRAAGPAQLILLNALIQAGALDTAAVDDLLQRARAVADRMLSAGA